MEIKVLLHIGIAKTGTTSLQQNLFDQLTPVLRIGQTYKALESNTCLESMKRDDDYE